MSGARDLGSYRWYNDSGWLVLDTGKKIPFVSSACLARVETIKEKPVVIGWIGAETVTTLRDTGCSQTAIHKD